MVRRSFVPTATAWNFSSFGLMIFLCCSGVSVARTKQYQLEIAEYKLAVGSALSDVKQASDTLERSADTLPIAREQKRKIEKLTSKTDAVLQRVQNDIEIETEKLIDLETE